MFRLGSGIMAVMADDRTFRGGMNIRVDGLRSERLNASIPAARLRVSDDGLELWTNSIAIPARYSSVDYRKREICEVFRSRGPGLSGVGIETVDGLTQYFWTFRADRVLAELASRGYAMDKTRVPNPLALVDRPWAFSRRRTE